MHVYSARSHRRAELQFRLCNALDALSDPFLRLTLAKQASLLRDRRCMPVDPREVPN